jgi:autotransporter-associated beta strand protein
MLPDKTTLVATFKTRSKTGAGTQILSGTSTYTGATTIDAGTLLVNGTLDTPTSAVTVNRGGTLGGTGTINRPVIVNDGGTLSIIPEPSALTLVGFGLLGVLVVGRARRRCCRRGR